MAAYTLYDTTGLILHDSVVPEENQALLLACDIGGTTVKMGIFTAEPQPRLLCRTEVPTRTEDEGVNILPDVAEAARALADDHGLRFSQIRGAGIGCPGPVLTAENGDYIVNRGVNLNWGVKNVSEEFRTLTGIPSVIALNDANAAALGEMAAAGASGTVIMVTLGTGVGGGIVIDGSVLSGSTGSAGEIGHMPASPYHPLLESIREQDPSFPARSDLEYYASATGIIRVAKAALKTTGAASVLRKPEASDLTAKDIFDAAREGDALAMSITEFYFDTLGSGLASIAGVIDPDLFLLGGGVSRAGDFLLDGVRRAYRENVFHSMRGTGIQLAVLGGDAGLLGAVIPLLQED